MDLRRIDERLSVSPQILPGEMPALAAAGFRAVICNRPDGEGADQPTAQEVEAAALAAGLAFRYLPVVPGRAGAADAAAFAQALTELPGPVAAFCRTGTRSATLWALSQAGKRPLPEILGAARGAGFDLSGLGRRLAGPQGGAAAGEIHHQVVIVGVGAAGIAVASSLKARRPELDIAIIDPAEVHYYQPGWTLVGAGVFDPRDTAKTMGSLIPQGVAWIRAAVVAFEPQANSVVLEGCRVVTYDRLVVCPGLKLDWDRIPGLNETLGHNGVTSNYRYDLAPYTWAQVRALKSGRALFTQPPMPIKCAGAPQKAMYLSADHWRRQGVLDRIDIGFMSAAGALFGVADYVPALMDYVNRYHAALNFHHTLVAVDGPAKTATFTVTEPGKAPRQVTEPFDLLHVVPPQTAPDFVRVSPLADAAGWVDVDPHTLRHKGFANIWSLGDAMNAPNAKTAAAARKQAPVVAANLVADLEGRAPVAMYDGYGSCPLTVEKGRIVLAEFGYGGVLKPSFPKWLIDGTKPSRAAWLLKERVLPPVYWQAMLKGREWMAAPEPMAAE